MSLRYDMRFMYSHAGVVFFDGSSSHFSSLHLHPVLARPTTA